MTNFSSRLMKELSTVLDQLHETLSQKVKSTAILLGKGVEMAVNCAVTTCYQWGLPVS